MDVKVTASGTRSGPIEWDIDGKKPKDSKLDFAKNSGPDTIKFKLFDRTGRNLRFDSADPFWAHESATPACPPAHAQSGETSVVSCSDKSLSVSNKNSKDCTIHYQLNAIDGDGNRQAVDPMIKNGGGQVE